MRPTLHKLAPLALFTLLAPLAAPIACGPTASGVPVAKPPPPAVTTPKLPPFESPARWTLHPSSALTMQGKLDLGSVGTLYVGNGGERWLDKHDSAQGPTPAPGLVDEPLVAIARASDGGLLLVAESGAIYPVSATDPLGKPGDRRAPPSKLRSVAAGKTAIVGIADGGVPMRTTDGGKTWSAVSLPTGTQGTLLQLAMIATGEGLALLAPQRVLATKDDGATWAQLATPGVGARRIFADDNGELMLEGLEASAILRSDPAHLEKINRAPSRDFTIPISVDDLAQYGDAVISGHAALVGQQYLEVIGDGDDSTRFKLAIGKLGERPMVKRMPQLDGCLSVSIGGDASSIVIACDRAGKSNYDNGYSGSGAIVPKPKIEDRWHLSLFRSTDSGASFQEDGAVTSLDRPAKHFWPTPDGGMIIDGACKRARNEYACEESPPVLRPAGSKDVVKVFGGAYTRFYAMTFAPNGHAYAIGQNVNTGRVSLYVSTDGGKDFTRHAIPSLPGEPGDDARVPYISDDLYGSISVDDAGKVALGLPTSDRWVIYETTDEGVTFTTHLAPENVLELQLAAGHGFAYGDDKGWESADSGETWRPVAVPRVESGHLACGRYGCLLGDHATRVGWDAATSGAEAPAEEAPKPKKNASLSTMRCTTDGAWTSLGQVSLPSASNADLGGGTRWVVPRRDAAKGSITAVVGTRGAKGVEVKEISLFGPSPENTATAMTMQLEGVAALRYSFKRDPLAKTAKAGTLTAITAKQTVDVEVAWYVAATGKVYRGTLRGVGPLDPYRDLIDGREKASTAKYALLSIAMGGIHLRPLGSAGPDSPLYFVSDAGAVSKLSWPEVPTKDSMGRALSLGLDAARVGKRTIVFAAAPGGIQMFVTWANEAGTSWEPHTWGLWPDLDDPTRVEPRLRYMDAGNVPAFGVLYAGSPAIATSGWMVPIRTPEADPSTVIPLPSQKQIGDPAVACDKAGLSASRLTLPSLFGTRHPMLVGNDGATLTMATGTAVVRFTDPKSWCLSAYDAQALVAAGSEPYVAIVSPDDMEHGSLFRGSATNGGEVMTRAMSCAYTKEAMPEALKEIDGFVE